jgi:hypothetical protein
LFANPNFIGFLILYFTFMSLAESKPLITTPQQFIEYVERLPEIELAVKEDIKSQLIHSGNGQRSSLKKIEVPYDIALRSLEAETKIIIGGTNVEIFTNNNEIILPRVDFKEFRGRSENLKMVITEDGRVVDMKIVVQSLAGLAKNSSVFLDFAYPLKYEPNRYNSAGGTIIHDNFGSYKSKGNDLAALKGQEVTQIISDITGKECSTLNDTIMGLLPNNVVLGINGTGLNFGYLNNGMLTNSESGNLDSEYAPKIIGLRGQGQPLQALIAGGNPIINSPEDNWGIPGVYNALSTNYPVKNSIEVFERAENGDKLSIAILTNSGWWYDMLAKGIYSYLGVEKTSENLGEIGSTLKALRTDEYIKI